MKTLWNIGERRPQDRAERHFQSIAMHLPPRRRVDIVLTVGLILTLISLAVLAATVVVHGERQGWFDAPLVQPLKDPRKLVNVRDDVAQHLLLDAVFHSADNRVYISQQGGTIHRYDPATELWSSLHPFAERPISPDLVQLRSGCGTDPLSSRVEECPDPDSLWMLGADGSLARLRSQRWEVVLNNTAFTRADGKPVESQDLTAADVSDDGRWLVLGTRGGGIGVYDLRIRQWLSVEPDVMENLPSREISQVVFWRDRFWLGTPHGLAPLEVEANRLQLHPTVLDAKIIDLAAEAQRLWILSERQCDNSGSMCLWLGQLDNPSKDPKEVLAERNRYTDLSLATVNHAQYWDEHLVLAGEAGIYLYDAVLHAWDQLFTEPVQAVLPGTEDIGMFFGYPGGVGQVEPSFITTTWPITGELVVKLLDFDQGVLALTERGNAWSVSKRGEVSQVFRHGHTALDPASFSAAVAAGDTVLFMGPDGALLHNVRTRQYEDLTVGVPDWLLAPDTKFVTAGDTVFAIEQRDSRAEVHLLPVDELANSNYYTSHDIDDATSHVVPSLPLDLWPWEPYGLGLVATDGRAYLVDSDSVAPQTGTGVQFQLSELRDVAEANDALVVVRNNDLHSYSLTSRSWSTKRKPELAPGEEIVEIAALGESLLVETSLGRLMQESATWTNLIGDTTGFGISDPALSDALANEQMLYLAGGGRVEAYDTAERALVQSWDIQGNGAVSLQGVLGGKPLTLSDGVASLGTTALDPEAGQVRSLSSDDSYIWTVRESGSSRYLLGHPASAPNDPNRQKCFFRQPQISGAERLVDARVLSDDTIVAVTEKGLRLYSPAARSWYHVEPDILQTEAKVYLLDNGRDDVLLLKEMGSNNTLHLHFVPVKSIQLPHSCSTEPAAMKVEATKVAIAADVNEGAGQVAWLEPNGSLWEWAGGSALQVLAPSGQGPQLANLRRVYERDSYLFFVAQGTLWRYDLDNRSWQQVTLRLSDTTSQDIDINVERDGARDVVTAHLANGDIYVGVLADGENSVHLDLIYQGDAATFDAEAEELVDVQRRNDNERRWTFVLTDRVQYYDPASREWERVERVPSSTPLTFQEALGRGILIGNGGRSWWVASQRVSHPVLFSEFVREPTDTVIALGGDGTIWRLLPDGQILECLPRDSTYTCQSHGSSPFSLDPVTIQHAFAWGKYIILETTSGLRAFDTDTWGETALTSEAANFRGSTASFELEGYLWLYNGTDLLSLDHGLHSTLQPNISDLMQDSQNRLWAELENGWHLWREDTWQPVAEVTSAAQDMEIFVLPRANITAVDAAKHAYYWTGTRFLLDDLPMPDGLPQIEHLIRGHNLDWWVIGQGRVYHVKRAVCGPTLEQATPPVTPAVATTCLKIAGHVDLALPDVAYAQQRSGEEIELRSNVGQSVVIGAMANGEYSTTLTSGIVIRPDLVLDDGWPTLRAKTVRLPNGQWAYDPPIGLALSSSGGLAVHRPSGNEEQLSPSAAIAGAFDSPFSTPPELDAGWLRWDRANRSFLVQSSTGLQALAPGQFIQSRQLAFEGVNAVLAPREDALYAAMDSGVWAFTALSLSLEGSDVVYYSPTPSSASVQGATHGRFVAGDLAVVVEPNSLRETSLEPISIKVGDVTFIERTASGQVATHFLSGNQTLAGAGDQNFLWDLGRRSLAYDGRTLLLQSDAGIHEARRLAGFDRGPNNAVLSEGKLQSDGQGNLYLFHGENWYRRLADSWTDSVPDPLSNATLVQTSYWEWMRRDGQLAISLANRPFAFALLPQGAGLGFNSDQMQAAAAYGNQLYVTSGAFLEVAGQAEDLGNFSAARLSPIISDRFSVFRIDGYQEALFSYFGQRPHRWDSSQNHFVAVDIQEDPSHSRVLLATNRIRFIWDQGRVVKEVWIDTIDGSGNWVPFSFHRGRFPFDYVTSLATFDNDLYVGTAAGLQIYDKAAGTALNRMTRLLDTRAQTPTSLASITQVGTPADQANLLIAQSAEGCVQHGTGQPFSQCSTLEPLQSKVKVKSRFWQWTRTPDGKVVGRYVTNDGSLADDQIQLVNGRWPHDTLVDVAACQGRLYTIWYSGWNSAHSGLILGIDGAIRNYDLSATPPQRLICLEQVVAMSDRNLPQGVYLESEGGRVSVYENNAWKEISDPAVIADLQEYATTPPVFYGGRLRLLDRSSAEELAFEQRSLNGQWHVMPWLETGEIGLDQWHEMVLVGSDLWVATPVGLVAFQTRAGSTSSVVLDPSALVVVREPLAGENVCLVSDLRIDNESVLARCNYRSDQVFEGKLSRTRDREVFKLNDTDPFAERPLVSTEKTGYWSFDLAGRAGGQPGFLEAMLRDEEIQLVAGRFQFDTINSLALFQQEVVELGTASGGWYQAPRAEKIRVSDLTRSPVARDLGQVNWVGLTGSANDNEQALCLRGAGGSEATLLDAEYAVRSRPSNCAEYQAEDSLWLYQAEEDHLNVIARDAIGGIGTRSLVGGRFSDDIALGLPVAAKVDGRLSYLLPTQAGIVQFDSDLRSRVLHAGPFEGLPDGVAPRTVYMLRPNAATYVGDGALYALTDTRDQIEDLDLGQLAGATVNVVEPGPWDLVRVRWLRGTQQGWSFLAPQEPAYTENALFVDVSEFERYIQHQLAWGSPAPVLTITYTTGQIAVQFGARATSVSSIPTGFELITPILFEDRLLLVGRQELLEVDLETGMVAAMERTGAQDGGPSQ